MKMSFWTLAALVLALCAVAATAQDCRADITQTLGSSWTVNGQAYSQWSVTITAGPKDVKSLTLSMSGDFDQVWEVNKDASGHYVLPDYVIQGGGIKAGKTHNFGYIIKQATRSTIAVLSVNCDSAAPSPSNVVASTAPSASASPAAPSASASPAAPSPSASSQPSTGCSLTTTQTARSAANGGQWKDTAYTYQIYDLAINNAGSKVVTDAQLTFTLGAGASFYQFWGLDRQDASQTFKVPNYGGVQVGSSQSAGYVIRTPLANGSPVALTVHVDSASCSGSNNGGQQPSPAASSSPAAPSPSTIVGSPQPSASASPAPSGTCSASVSIVARSGSNWQDGSGFNQIYDITIKNTGSRAIRGGEVTFGLGQGVSITQFWELNRKTANQFSIPTTYGPLQVGASQGAGIVATRAQAPIDTPTLTLDSVTCY